MVNILEIEIEQTGRFQVAAAVDLPGAGEAGEDRQAFLEPLRVDLAEPLAVPQRERAGPTRLIRPWRTLKSWGSSSRLVRRRKHPTHVTRGS